VTNLLPGAAASLVVAGVVAGTVGFLALVAVNLMYLKVQEPTVAASTTKEDNEMVKKTDLAFLNTIQNIGAGLVSSLIIAGLIRA
jgi:hypothetical protein